MSDRNTFHESWYKVSDLLPQIHISLRISRQKYRGRIWYVVQDPGNNQFFRVNVAAYQFLAYLDGRRTVDQDWNLCYEEYGDEAPTQGEAITLLGQLYSSNLLQGDVPADTEGLLKRHQRRLKRETSAYIKGILFARVPLFNPDVFLDKWSFLFGPIFSKIGYMFGALLIGLGLTFVFNNFDALIRESGASLSLSNAPWLYLMFAVSKILHEFGHGFACKYYGKKTHTGGSVNTMGMAFLLLTPVPYVDATSSWALKNKWMRAAVAGAGMYVELLLAAGAAILWSQTSPGDALHVLSFNVMFVASVTTILFNGNPLMRYDAYYILSDVFEIPNLSGRSKLHLKYVFRKFMFGVRQAVSPSYDFFESSFMTVYGVLAEAYKFVIFSSLILLASELNPALGLIGLCAYLFIGVVMPLFKFFRYLVIDPELARTRVRSLGISALIFGGLLYLILGIELNDRIVVEGVIEPVNLKQVYIQSDGFVTLYKKRQFPVKKDETVIYIADNPELTLEIEQAKAEMEGLEVLIRAYAGVQPARKTIHQNSYNALLKKVELLKQETERLVAKAPISGLFIPIGDRDITGKFMAKGEKLGIIVSPNDLIIRSVISQDTSRILEESSNTVKFRLRARPDLEFSGVVDSREAVGKNKLPSVALGYHGGGETEVNSTEQGNESKEFFFEIVLKPEDKPWPLKPGQIVAVRFELQKKSIFEIVEGFVNRLLLRRFRI